MGNSAPPPAAVDLIDSFARHAGDEIEIVLREPSTGQDCDQLVLRKSGVRVTGPLALINDQAGTALVARVPKESLSDGTWAIRLRHENGPARRRHVEARLLVQGSRPPVLLWGAEAVSSDSGPRTSRTTPDARQLGRSAIGGAATRVLRLLPAAQRLRVLSMVRRTAGSS